MTKTKKLTLSALFIALGIILPFFTGQIPRLGNMLLPMHIPVLICGFVCGMPYGLFVGCIIPLLRSVLFSMPAMPLSAIPMAVELGTYGLITGLLYFNLQKKRLAIYITLIASMIGGRITWGLASYLLYNALGHVFTWKLFVAGAFFNAIPGIIVQLIFIPPLIYSLNRTHLGHNT